MCGTLLKIHLKKNSLIVLFNTPSSLDAHTLNKLNFHLYLRINSRGWNFLIAFFLNLTKDAAKIIEDIEFFGYLFNV